LLLFLNVVVAGYAVRKRCFLRDGLEFNHVLTFTIGFLVYWILPIAFGLFGILRGNAAIDLWYSIFDRVSNGKLTEYLVITLLIYLAFLGGDSIGRAIAQVKGSAYRPLFFYKRLLDMPLLVGCILAAAYTFALRGQLFRGYNLISLAEAADLNRGSFTAVSVFLLGLAFIYTLKRQEDSENTLTFWKLICNRYFAIYLICSILVLSLGGRLYLVSSIVMLLVYTTRYFRPLPVKRAAMLSIIGFIIFGTLGIIRQTNDLSANKFLVNVMAEPMYTSFSLVYYLGHNDFELINFPVFLLSQFLNLVPTAIFPQKADMMLDPEQFGYTIFSPLGALNSFFSFMINFGVVGTMLAIGTFGVLMSYLRKRDANMLYRVFYITFCGWMGFTFFRDPFFISVVKTMFEFSFAVPLFLVLAAQMLSITLRAFTRRPAQAPEPMAS